MILSSSTNLSQEILLSHKYCDSTEVPEFNEISVKIKDNFLSPIFVSPKSSENISPFELI